jgi:4-amino-4-deoxy-L-arabinose transferase-like glycosyltransferase
MYLLDSAKIPVTLTNTLLATIVIDALLIAYAARRHFFKLPSFKPFPFRFNLDWQEKLLLILITLKIGLIFFSALIKPMIDVDAFQFYSIAAKGLYYKHTILAPQVAVFYGTKPVLPILAQGWTLIGLQTDNDIWLKLISPLLLLSLVILFYQVLRRTCSRKYSLLFTFFLSGLPFLVYHATTAYADIPITFYFTACCLFLYVYFKSCLDQPENKNQAALFISSIMAAGTIWSKNAGIALIGVVMLVVGLSLFNQRQQMLKQDWRKILFALLLLLLLIFPLIIPRIHFTIGTLKAISGQVDTKTLEIASTRNTADISLWQKTSVIAQICCNKLFFYGDWQLTWALLIIALIFFYRRSMPRETKFLLLVLLLSTLTVLVQFESTGTFTWLLDGTLFDRLIMNEVPLALFVSAIIVMPGLGKIQSKNDQKKNACAPKSSKKH